MIVIDECNIRKSVLKLSLPSVAEQALFMVVGVVSTILVGWIGKEAISAVGLINILVGFIMALFVALSTGSTVLVARLIGEGDPEKAKQAMRQSVVLGAIVSLFISLILFLSAESVIRLFYGKADQQVIQLAVTYFRITMVTFPLLLINIMISGCLRGAGDTRTPMGIALVVNILNIALGYLLIVGIHLPFLKVSGLGIAGAAWAVAVSRGVGGLLSVGALYLPSNVIRTTIFQGFKLDVEMVKRVFRVGIPAAAEQLVMQGGFLVLQIVISGMGTVGNAVYQICMSINSICFVPVWGFGIAATTLVGQSLGARKPETAEKCGWSTLRIGLAVITALTVLIFIFPAPLISLYSSDPEVISMGVEAIRIFSFSQPFLAVVVVISGSLRGAGDIKFVMVSSFVGIWGFRILLTVLLDYFFHLGIMGVWVAYIADFFIRSMMYLLRFQRGKWKYKVV